MDYDEQRKQMQEICAAAIERCYAQMFIGSKNMPLSDLKKLIEIVREAWYLSNNYIEMIGEIEGFRLDGDVEFNGDSEDEDEDEGPPHPLK